MILFSFVCGKAQKGDITFGIKGGMNWANLSGSGVDSLSNGGKYQSLSGQIIGISVNNKISKYVWLKHEVFYARRFLNVQLNDGIHPTYISNIKRQYLDIFPANVTFQYKGIQAYAGAYVGTLLSASIQRKDSLGNLYKDKTFYGNPTLLSNYAQKFDAGFKVGIEYEFKVGLNIGASYIQGFVPLIENAAKQPQWKIYNQYYNVTIGYSFNKKVKKDGKK